MTLRRLLLSSALALSFSLSAPTAARADPITAAVVTFIGFTGTAAAVATFVINTALYAAGSWAVGKAAQALGVGKMSVAERQASVTALSLGEVPREAILGEACTGGSLVDAFNFGGQYDTGTTSRCIALADHPCEALVGYYVDDQFYPWRGDGVQPGFGGRLSIEFYNARAEGWDPPLHVRQNGGWTLADRNVGLTFVWVDTRFDDKVWTQGHPRLRFVVRGLRAYDPRKDAALGYTGPNPHVWSDPATHEFTRNAEVLRYNYQRGIFAAGRHGQIEHLLIGRGLSAEEAPPERIIAAANICDEVVDGEARYTANGVISAAQSFIDVEEMFAAAMAGVIIQPEGGVGVEPGHAKAVELTITDADLAAGEGVVFSEFLPDNEEGRINTVIPRYVEPSQGWKDFGGPPRRNLADLIEDGGPREVTLPLMLVTSGKQADRCAEIRRRRGRLERRASIVLPPDYAAIEEGDWIAWRSDRYHGGATVRYQVTSYSLDEKWRMRLSLEEIASSVYGVPDPVEAHAEPPSPPVPVDALQLFGVVAESITLAGESSVMPAIRFRWDVVDGDEGMIAIRAEVRRQGETEAAPTRFEDVAKGEMIVTNGVGPDMALEARLVPIGDPSRPVLPSNWTALSTGGLVASDVSPNAPSIANLQGQITAAFGDIFDVSSLLADARADIDAQGVEIAAARGGQADLNSRIVQVNQARIDGDTANAEAISLVQARTANTEADIIDLENALANETTARAEAISQVSARSALRPNLIDNPSGKAAFRGWLKEGSAASHVDDDEQAGRIFVVSGYMVSQVYPAKPGDQHSLSYNASPLGDGGHIRIQYVTPGGLPEGVYVASGAGDIYERRRSVAPSTAPGGTTGFRLVVVAPPGGVLPVWAIKVNSGSVAADFSDDYSATVVEASVTQQSLAIIDLENQQNIALWRIKAEASGGRPAIIEAYSGLGVSALAFSAGQIYFGENTVLDDPTDTLRTTVGSVRYVQTWGAPFGPDNLLRWTGPSSVPEGAETKANAGANGAWVDSTGLAFTGGATLSGPFDSGALSATLIGLSAGWTTVATVASKYVAANGGYIFRADWQATLSPKSPPSGAPIYGLNWRVISSNQSGGDVRVVSSGYVTGPPGTANIAMGQPYTLVTGHVSLVGERKLHLQLALSGTDDVTAASARNARLQGVYYA